MSQHIKNTKNESFTKREQAIYILGMLGYKIEDLENALELLEENAFQDIVDFYYSLKIYNAENCTCSTISLAGNFATLKIKDGNWDEVVEIMTKHNITL